MDKDLKNEVEAVLFASGRTVSLKELQQLTRTAEPARIKESVIELRHEYEDRDSPIMIVDEADGWKLAVKERYLGVVHSINPHTELSKSILETLAVIAWKQPALQADVIKIRTNKAYDHIAELDKLGFLTKERHGRSYLLKVSKKFMDYFDLPDDASVKELFKGFKDVEVAVQKKVEEFEKDIPEEDKEAMENRTPEELAEIARESEDVGLETFEDELPPVKFPRHRDEVHVYSDAPAATSEEQGPEDAEVPSRQAVEQGSDRSDDTVPSGRDALSIAKSLLEEENEETSEPEKRVLHPRLESMIDDTVRPKPLEKPKLIAEKKAPAEPYSEDQGTDEKPAQDDESDDEKPAEEFPGQFR